MKILNGDDLNLSPEQWRLLTLLLEKWANSDKFVPFHLWLLDEKEEEYV